MACSCVPLLLVLQRWKHSDSSTETRDRTLNTQFHEIALLAQIEPGHSNFPILFPFRFNPFQPSKPELLSPPCYTSAGRALMTPDLLHRTIPTVPPAPAARLSTNLTQRHTSPILHAQALQSKHLTQPLEIATILRASVIAGVH